MGKHYGESAAKYAKFSIEFRLMAMKILLVIKSKVGYSLRIVSHPSAKTRKDKAPGKG
jgi:hypothetical protein